MRVPRPGPRLDTGLLLLRRFPLGNKEHFAQIYSEIQKSKKLLEGSLLVVCFISAEGHAYEECCILAVLLTFTGESPPSLSQSEESVE